jgi:hypothetical protein
MQRPDDSAREPDAADSEDRPRNPYAVGPEPPRPEPGTGAEPERGPRRDGPAPGRGAPRRPVDRAVLRRVRRVVLLGALAAFVTVPLPPLGLALGVLTLVLAARLRREPEARQVGIAATLLPLLAGSFAVVVGAALSALALWLGQEIGDLRDCLGGALTRAAEQSCQDQFREAVEERLVG